MTFTYNVLSEEKEGGTWSLIRLHAASPLKLIWQKLALRLAVVYAVAAALLVLAIILLPLPLNPALLAVALLLALYLLFWFALSFWIISWQKSSSFNAVCMLAIWVVLTILAPALVNSYISQTYPVPEALQTAVKQRQGYHEKWDMDKASTMNKFYAHYPQYRQYPLPDTQFSWLWYYAMQHMGDADARHESEEFTAKLWQRENASARIALLLPVLHTQLALNNLAGTGLPDHLQFMEATNRFHEEMRLSFYPRIFEDSPVSSVDWQTIPVQYFTPEREIPWLRLFLPLVLISAVLFILGRLQFYRIPREVA
jgi:ABC-2 type transport system permease protein